jgi:hypothetical protein
MKIVLIALGILALVGLSGGLGYAALRGSPGTPVLTDKSTLSIRNYSASVTPSSRRRRSSSGVYYGGSRRRHYGGGYSSGK